MPHTTIELKLDEIEKRAGNLINQTLTNSEAGLEQEYIWILGCISDIKTNLKFLGRNHGLLYEIKDLVEKGGEPVFIVKSIKNLLRKLDELP